MDEEEEQGEEEWGGAPAEVPAPRENPLLLGHEAAEEALIQAHHSGRLPHAWLIGGPRGIGKATLAFRFARFLFAEGRGGGLFAAAPKSLALPPEDPVFRRVAGGGHAREPRADHDDVAVLAAHGLPHPPVGIRRR